VRREPTIPDQESGRLPAEIAQMCREAKALRHAISTGRQRLQITHSDQDRQRLKLVLNKTRTFIGAHSVRFERVLDRYTKSQIDVIHTCLESLSRAYGKYLTSYQSLRYAIATRLGIQTQW